MINIKPIDKFQFEIDGETIAATKKAKIVGDMIYLDDKFRCGMVIKIPFSELQIDGETPEDIETATRILNTFVGTASSKSNSSGETKQKFTQEQAAGLINMECCFYINYKGSKSINVKISDPAYSIEEGDLLVMRHLVKRRSSTYNGKYNRKKDYMAAIIDPMRDGANHWYNLFSPKTASDFVSENFVVWKDFNYNFVKDFRDILKFDIRHNTLRFRGSNKGKFSEYINVGLYQSLAKTVIDFAIYRKKKPIAYSRNKIILRAFADWDIRENNFTYISLNGKTL